LSQHVDFKLRPRTGAMQFQADWPGLFVRGDDAMLLLAACQSVAAGDYKHPSVLYLREIGIMISRDVLKNEHE
jgi:hypothetical protein